MEITLSPARHVFKCQKTGFGYHVLQRTEEFSIKMREIVKEMRDKMPEGFLGMKILLSAILTISSLNFSSAIETVLILSLGQMGQF